MSALSILRRGFIGVAAVALPAAGLVAALLLGYHFRDPEHYLAGLGLAYLAVGGMAWTGVRFAGFSTGLAMALPSLPFVLLLLIAFPVRYGDTGTGFLIAFGELALAVFVAWWAASRLARNR